MHDKRVTFEKSAIWCKPNKNGQLVYYYKKWVGSSCRTGSTLTPADTNHIYIKWIQKNYMSFFLCFAERRSKSAGSVFLRRWGIEHSCSWIGLIWWKKGPWQMYCVGQPPSPMSGQGGFIYCFLPKSANVVSIIGHESVN
jgi:hypothetical protein